MWYLRKFNDAKHNISVVSKVRVQVLYTCTEDRIEFHFINASTLCISHGFRKRKRKCTDKNKKTKVDIFREILCKYSYVHAATPYKLNLCMVKKIRSYLGSFLNISYGDPYQ